MLSEDGINDLCADAFPFDFSGNHLFMKASIIHWKRRTLPEISIFADRKHLADEMFLRNI